MGTSIEVDTKWALDGESGLWTPAALGAKLVAWWRADLGITIATGVSAWADQSGNGRTLLQATPGAQPARIAAGTPAGGPCLRFDGVDDFLLTAGFTLNQPEHVIVCAKWGDDGVGVQGLIDGVTANTGKVYKSTGSTVATAYAGGFGPTLDIGAEAWGVLDVLFNGAGSKIGFNGGAHATGNAGASNMGGFSLGGKTADIFGKLDAYGAIIANAELTAAERAAAVAFFRSGAGF